MATRRAIVNVSGVLSELPTGDTLDGVSSGGGSKTLAIFTPLNNDPPASAYATLDRRNGITVLDFDAATIESAIFSASVREGASLASGIKVRILWMATSATTNAAMWGAEFFNLTTDLDSDSYDAQTTATTTTSGTAGIPVWTEITCTSIDSLAVGDGFRLRVQRVANNAADTMTGDAELIMVELQQVA